MKAPRPFLMLVWVAATLLGFMVAATTRIGPVLLTIYGSHGVHLGDVIGFAVAYSVAVMLTLRVLTRRSRPRPDGRRKATIGRNPGR